MAEQDMKMKRKRVIKEGILQKKTSLLKQWRPRFVVLNRQLLCTFKKEDDEKRGRTAEARIFLMDIESIEKFETKKRKHCFNLIVEGKPFFSFCCSSELDRELWVRSVQTAKENELKEEENDPVRRKSTKLTGGLKRITIPREKGQGLGCTIKNVGGVIFVNRILEDGPVSTSGILRPGDQILDINGIELGGRSVSEISEIIKGSPEVVVCTVKPSSDYRYCDTHASEHTEYAEIDLNSLKTKDDEDSGVLSKESSFDNQGESTDDQKTSSNSQWKRHSLPTVLPDSQKAETERNKEDSVNYLELNFPGMIAPVAEVIYHVPQGFPAGLIESGVTLQVLTSS
ncbi:hypothetical protein OS493_014386 [Desmophyllum pertusum]|uniref:PH domain-containing protein n=1 Tax=Desmophyllum pertusum TaxID=174260 RepID=A0A9X0CL26_9CNID|nr:hypothetical protein OS493_014386 [Desmophyllum pertusum]